MKTQERLLIVGGGQLGRMMIPPARELGLHVTVIDPTPRSPAGKLAHRQIVADFNDGTEIRKLAGEVDYATVEIEHIDIGALVHLVEAGVQVNPSPDTLLMIKDKFGQKTFLAQAGIPTAEFTKISSRQDIDTTGETFGYPFLLKVRFGAYDGRGNVVVRDRDSIPSALEKLGTQSLYAEKYVEFEKELAVVAARDVNGNIATYPVVETYHEDNICHTVFVPAPVPKETSEQAEALALKTMQHLEGAGVFGIEMFLTKDGQVLVNEIAPRVHNSGHYTIEACETSQFKQHVLAVTGRPLGSTQMTVPAAVMINILGERYGKAQLSGTRTASELGGVFIHQYGKRETRKQRKMGHLTAVGTSLEKAYDKAVRARRIISI